MRLLIALLPVLLLGASSVSAEIIDVKVDNSIMPAVDVAQVFINESGQLEILSVGGEYEISKKIVGTGDVLINSFTINNVSQANLQPNATGIIRWSTTNADECSASATPTNLPLAEWNTNTVIGTVSTSHLVTFTNAGNYILQLDCSNVNGSVANSSVGVHVGGASITLFKVTPETAVSGTNVTLTLQWASQNTLSCSGSANWPNSISLNSTGTQTISVPNINADRQYTLSCAGLIEGDNVSDTVVVSVTQPQQVCNPSLVSGQKVAWVNVFGESWPKPNNKRIRRAIPEKGYLAVEFNTGQIKSAGYFSNIEASGTPGYRIGAISSCAGDFEVSKECKFTWGGEGGIVWETSGLTGYCTLKPNTTYYWNMTFTDGKSSNTSRCVGSYCETVLINYN